MTEPVEVTPDFLRANPLPKPDEGGDKDGRGRVLVVAGSMAVPGAAVLAGVAALRAGAGKLQMAVCRSLAIPMGMTVLEALVLALDETPDGGIVPQGSPELFEHAGRCDAVLVGPGMVAEDDAAALTLRLLTSTEEPAFVIDAAALSQLAHQREALHAKGGRVVITPHAGEMANLLGISKDEVQADALGVALRCARMLQVIVVLKGSTTHIAVPDGRAWVNRHGSVALATSGSGDTLAGAITGLLARGAEPWQAAAWGVRLHAEAGQALTDRLGQVGLLARELPAEMPAILQRLS